MPQKSALNKSVGPHILVVCVSLFMCNVSVLKPVQLAFSLEVMSHALKNILILSPGKSYLGFTKPPALKQMEAETHLLSFSCSANAASNLTVVSVNSNIPKYFTVLVYTHSVQSITLFFIYKHTCDICSCTAINITVKAKHFSPSIL